MNVSQEHVVRFGFWATLLLSIFAWAPAAYPGYWQALEGFVPVFNAARGGALAGVATIPDLWRGTGSGAFVFAQPLIVLGLSATAAVRVVFGLSFVLGGLGIYIWLRSRLGDRPAGLAALLFMFWPPFLATVYVRGSVADAVVMGILPLALAGLAAYVETRAPSAAGIAVLSVLWMWRTQAGLALFATILLLIYVIVVERSRLAVLVVGVSGAAGLATLIPQWDVRGPAVVDFNAAFVSIYALLAGGWPFGMDHAATALQHTPPVPVQLGIAMLVFGLATLWFWWSSRLGVRADVLTRTLAFAYVLILVACFLALPVSNWLWQATGAQRLVSYPWQPLLLAGPFFAAAAGSLPALQPVLTRTRYWSVLAALVILGSYPYLQAEFTQIRPPERPVAIFGEVNEIVVLDAQLTEDADAQAAELTLTWQVLRTPEFDYNVFFQALAPDDGHFRTVAQLDTQPLQGLLPATTWQPGDIYTDTYHLDLSDATAQVDLAQTALRFDFGYYDWRDGVRLPIDGGIDDKLMFYGR
jgi:hypothetical protein